MVNYMEAKPDDDMKELEDTRGCHAKFIFLESQYTHHLVVIVQGEGDDKQLCVTSRFD